ncbi:MAG: argininosuccinate synthase [Deltaproteobacteria bacterium]|nr:MAG: argininosuccinate synthase [Deltaproteobacteria bacterium]
MSSTVAVAFSGGLDTSWLVARYAERGHRVVAITVDTGGWTPEGRTALRKHALTLGAGEHVLIDGREPLYNDHIAWLIRGNVLRGGVYPLCVGVERIVQAQLFAQAAKACGAELLVHGSTGAGNDQVRFDVTLRAILPGAKIEAPIRDEAVTREQSAAWLSERGLGPMQSDATLSINRGLWGTTAGGGVTHDPWSEPGEDAFTTTIDPQQAPTEGASVVLRFREGLPVGLDDTPIEGWPVVEALHDLGAAHGIGRGVHLGDTILGIKGRVAFEAPAAAILLPAHRELEKLVLTAGQRSVKDHLGDLYGQLVHEARGLDPLARDIEALLASSQRRVEGEVRVRVRQGSVQITGVRSPYSLMAVQETAYGEHTGLWSGGDARGFARIHGVPAYLAARASEV